MNVFVYIALFGWIPVATFLFMAFPARTAITANIAFAWAYLPLAGFKAAGLPEFSKLTVTTLTAALGAVIFHGTRTASLRLGLVDLPMLCWTLAPGIASISNGLGIYDAASAMLNHAFLWTLPYLLGRTFFKQASDLRDMVGPIILCGLTYVPLCLFEVRMSPQLHKTIYGFSPWAFNQAIRGDGYRPAIFMRHGLMVGIWMGSVFVLAMGWWIIGKRKGQLLDWATWLKLIALGSTFILLKSTGAAVLTLLGCVTLWLCRTSRRAIFPCVLALAVPLYIGARTTGLWSGDIAVNFASALSAERAQSLDFRLRNEDLLVAKAKERYLFGWAGWGRARVYDSVTGQDISHTDGLWIISFGNYGLFGLASLFSVLIIGPVVALYRSNPTEWKISGDAVLTPACATVCLMAAVDALPNGMVLPPFVLMLGAVTSISVNPVQQAMRLRRNTPDLDNSTSRRNKRITDV